MRILIVEDQDYRIRPFVYNLIGCAVEVTKSSTEAIELLDKKHWDCLFLDHDLEGPVFYPSGPKTGYEVACWLEERPEKQPKVIIVHSQNPVGTENIKRALPNALAIPKCWEFENIIEIIKRVHG